MQWKFFKKILLFVTILLPWNLIAQDVPTLPIEDTLYGHYRVEKIKLIKSWNKNDKPIPKVYIIYLQYAFFPEEMIMLIALKEKRPEGYSKFKRGETYLIELFPYFKYPILNPLETCPNIRISGVQIVIPYKLWTDGNVYTNPHIKGIYYIDGRRVPWQKYHPVEWNFPTYKTPAPPRL